MIKISNISDFDIRLNIFTPSLSGSGQRIVTKGSATYSNVWAKEVKSNLSDDDEAIEYGQVVARYRRSFCIRKRDMSLSTNNIVTVVDESESEDFHVISVHPYGADRELVVLECMSRDSD